MKASGGRNFSAPTVSKSASSSSNFILMIGGEMKYETAQGPIRRMLSFKPEPNINVTPLIDVLLVLLIIFMVIQPHRESKFESQIPKKPRENPEERPTPPPDLLVVEVKTGAGLDQTVELNSTPMSLLELGPVLKEVLEQRLTRTVYIKAPKEKQYGDVVDVIDVLKGAGAQPIGLQIDYL